MVWHWVLSRIRRNKVVPNDDEEVSLSKEEKEDVANDAKHSTMVVIVSIIVLLVYLGVGILFYSLQQGWNAGDAFYFTIVTLATVGYGDFSPKDDGGKLFTVLFIFVGISMAGYALGVVGGFVLKRQQELFDKIKRETSKRDKEKEVPKKRFKLSPEAKKLVYSLTAVVVTVSVGTIVAYFNEPNIGGVDAFYWSVVTCTTVGYGDVPLTKRSTRIFAAFYIMVGTFAVASSVGNFADIFIQRQQKKIVNRILTKKLTLVGILAMDKDNSGGVNRMEFLEYMLIKLGKVKDQEIADIHAQFDKLDTDKSGFLNNEDLKTIANVT